MNPETIRVVRVERVDNIPVLLAMMQRLRLAELLDQHYPAHHLWEGELTPGEVVCVWLTFLLSEGDHRLYKLQPWAQRNLLTLQACLGKEVRALDFHDDRLADLLSALPEAERWLALENDLNSHTVRVYDLKASRFRLDSTTANSHAAVVSEEGLLQFGHSKDRDDLPQLKVAVAALDPLGMPACTLVVPGNDSDDPLYVPLIQQIQQSCGKGGKTYVMDCKGAALATRAYLVSTGDFYLGPLSESQFSKERRLELIRRVRAGEQAVQPVYAPKDSPEDEDILIAEGFAVEETLQALVNGKQVVWTERRWLVRSVAFAQGQQEQLHRRLAAAEQELLRLAQRKQGKEVLSAEPMRQQAEQILQKHRVAGLLQAEVHTSTQQRKIRRYGSRPERIVEEETHRVEVRRPQEAIAAAEAEMGWQVYGVNDLGLSLEGVVFGYRGQYRIEKGFSRMKGRPLSLVPMYLADEGRMMGLVLLLSLALRVLTLLEYQVREKLRQGGEKLKGIYPGQPGRQTSRPSAEMLLAAFKGISLTVVEAAGKVTVHITPLTPLQQRLLALWDFPADLYQRLTALHGAELDQRLTALHCSEPPPVFSER
jgi:transposase